MADDQIAATAAVSGFIIWTQDISLFVAADVPVLKP
jgi:predicted nucleic acid-binding protein